MAEKAAAKIKKHKTSVKYRSYKTSGDKVEREKSCPKCGTGTFLARHKDRLYCGKCHYTEFTGKK